MAEHVMSAQAPPLRVPRTAADQDVDRRVGAITRAIAWIVDVLIIDLVSILTGVGVALVARVIPTFHIDQTLVQVIAGVVYVVWSAAYFVVFWATTGQTPGARVMQIRLLGPQQQRVKVARALVRWVGMQLAILPLFAGYAPLLIGRRPFPDWLAHTSVEDAPDDSIAKTMQRRRQRSTG